MSGSIKTPVVEASVFGRALLEADSDTPEGIVGPDGLCAPRRFNVYRNNVVVSLCDALGETFPAIKNLLGEDYFNALARTFVKAHPPTSPVLMWYGGDFAGFIEAFPPLAGYPYLGDVARLEWAWLQAFHAADAAPLDPGLLNDVAPDAIGAVTFTRHPAAALVASRWPVWDLLRANRFAPDQAIDIDLVNAQQVLITRQDLDVEVFLLRPGGEAFVGALFGGATLGEAAALGQAQNELFSLSDCLSDCLSGGAFTDLATA